MKVFEMISKRANDLLAESIKSLKRKPSKYTKPITPVDIITYLAMRLSLTWKDAKTTIQQKYKSCKESWWIGYNRFSVISNFAIANLYKLRDTLNSTFAGSVDLSTYLAIDEALYAYEGDSPVRRYFPRKPHKTGHLIYLICSKMNRTNLPFVHWMYPILPKILKMLNKDVKELNQIVLHFVEKLSLQEYDLVGTHVIFDAAFTSIDLAKELLKYGLRCTGSISSNKAPKWFPVIERNLDVGTGRTLIDKDGIMWIAYKEDVKTIHTAMSTSFFIDHNANMKKQLSELKKKLEQVKILNEDIEKKRKLKEKQKKKAQQKKNKQTNQQHIQHQTNQQQTIQQQPIQQQPIQQQLIQQQLIQQQLIQHQTNQQQTNQQQTNQQQPIQQQPIQQQHFHTSATRFRSVKPQIQHRQQLFKLIKDQQKLIKKIKDKDLKEEFTCSNENCMKLLRPQKIIEFVNVQYIVERVVPKSKSKKSSSSSPSSKLTSTVKLLRKQSSFKYRVKWMDNTVSLATASQFVKNYKLNYHFIIFAQKVDYMDFFNSFMMDELKKYCQSIGTSQSK